MSTDIFDDNEVAPMEDYSTLERELMKRHEDSMMVDEKQLQSDLLRIYLDGDQFLQTLLSALQLAITKDYWESVNPIKQAIYALRKTDKEHVKLLVAKVTSSEIHSHE